MCWRGNWLNGKRLGQLLCGFCRRCVKSSNSRRYSMLYLIRVEPCPSLFLPGWHFRHLNQSV